MVDLAETESSCSAAASRHRLAHVRGDEIRTRGGRRVRRVVMMPGPRERSRQIRPSEESPAGLLIFTSERSLRVGARVAERAEELAAALGDVRANSGLERLLFSLSWPSTGMRSTTAMGMLLASAPLLPSLLPGRDPLGGPREERGQGGPRSVTVATRGGSAPTWRCRGLEEEGQSPGPRSTLSDLERRSPITAISARGTATAVRSA